jgi:hypothetical protein
VCVEWIEFRCGGFANLPTPIERYQFLVFLSDPAHEKLSERKAWENLSCDLHHRVERT